MTDTDEKPGKVVNTQIIDAGTSSKLKNEPALVGTRYGEQTSYSSEKTFLPEKRSDPLAAILRGEKIPSQERALPSEIVDISKSALERAIVLYQRAENNDGVKNFLATYLAPVLPKKTDGEVDIDILNDPNNIRSIVEKFISETKEQGIFLGLGFAEREYQALTRGYQITQKETEPAVFPDSSKIMYSFEGGVGFEIDPSTGAITFKYGEPTKMTYEQYVEKAKKDWEEARKSRFARWFTHRGKEPKLMSKEDFEKMQTGKKGSYRFEFKKGRQLPKDVFDKFYLQQIGLLTQSQGGSEVLSDPVSDIETIKFLGRRVMEMGTVVQEYCKATGVPERIRIEKIKTIISGNESLFSSQQFDSVKQLIEDQRRKTKDEAQKRIKETRDRERVEASRGYLSAEKKRLDEEIEKRKQEEEERKQETGISENDKSGLLSSITERLKRVGGDQIGQEIESLLVEKDQLTYEITQLEAEVQANQPIIQQLNEDLRELRRGLFELRKAATGGKITVKDKEGNISEQEIDKASVLKQIQKVEEEIKTIEKRQELTAVAELAKRKKELAGINYLLSQQFTFNGQTKSIEQWLSLLEEQGEKFEESGGEKESLENLQKRRDEIEILLEITDPEKQEEIAQRQAEVDSFATTYLDKKGLEELIINNPLLAEAINLNDIKNLQLIYILFGKEAILGGIDKKERIQKIAHFLLSGGKPLLEDFDLNQLREKIDEIRLNKVKELNK